MWGYTIDTLCKPKNEKNEKNIEQLDIQEVNS